MVLYGPRQTVHGGESPQDSGLSPSSPSPHPEWEDKVGPLRMGLGGGRRGWAVQAKPNPSYSGSCIFIFLPFSQSHKWAGVRSGSSQEAEPEARVQRLLLDGRDTSTRTCREWTHQDRRERADHSSPVCRRMGNGLCGMSCMGLLRLDYFGDSKCIFSSLWSS